MPSQPPSPRRSSKKPPGFDFSRHMRILCGEMVPRVEALQHIRLAQVGFAVTSVRAPGPYGIQASLTPLRFAGGSMETTRRGRRHRIQRVLDEAGNELLYLMTIYLPRFQDSSLDQKINTVLHELWHIGPKFDGDLRRFAGRQYAHGPKGVYERQVQKLVDAWWAASPPAECYEFLKLSFKELLAQHGNIRVHRYAKPRLLPIPASEHADPRKNR